MKVVAILGMHRSGTSCLAGSLEAWGLPLGEVVVSARYNKRGSRENPRLFGLHEAVLADNGGSWQNPVTVTEWRVERLDALGALIGEHSSEVWGFKDPRSLFLLDGWHCVIPRSSFQYVATFRHPLAVARSLNVRNGMSIARGLKLWNRYNERLLALMEDIEIHLLDFDVAGSVYNNRIASICRRLDLGLAEPQAPFREANLISHHNVECTAELDPVVVRTYEQLLMHAQ